MYIFYSFWIQIISWNLNIPILRSNVWRINLSSYSSFELDLSNESVDSVHQTGLNDLFMNQFDPLLEFTDSLT